AATEEILEPAEGAFSLLGRDVARELFPMLLKPREDVPLKGREVLLVVDVADRELDDAVGAAFLEDAVVVSATLGEVLVRRISQRTHSVAQARESRPPLEVAQHLLRVHR